MRASAVRSSGFWGKRRKETQTQISPPPPRPPIIIPNLSTKNPPAPHAAPPSAALLLFAGEKAQRATQSGGALVSFPVGVIKSINCLCRQLKQTGAAERPR